MLIKIDSRKVSTPELLICGSKLPISADGCVDVSILEKVGRAFIKAGLNLKAKVNHLIRDEKGDVPGWVLVVLMTTGLVTAIWTIAAPKLTSILRNSLDAMNGVH